MGVVSVWEMGVVAVGEMRVVAVWEMRVVAVGEMRVVAASPDQPLRCPTHSLNAFWGWCLVGKRSHSSLKPHGSRKQLVSGEFRRFPVLLPIHPG